MPPRRTKAPAKPRTLAEAADQEYFAVMYYGWNGTGKTTNAAHMAKLGPVAYFRADRSVRRRPLTNLGVPVGNIELFDTLDTEEIVQYAYQFMQRLEETPASLAGAVIDTTTELIARRLEAIVDYEWVNTWREGDTAKRYFVDYTYYQPITQELRRVARHYRDLNMHFAMTAQIRRDVDENSGKVQYGPAVNPALQGDLLAYCDFVIRTTTDGFWPADQGGEPVYVGKTRPEETYMGKDREHVLPKVLVDPTFDRVVAYARGDLTAASDPRMEAYRELRRLRAERIARARAKK